MSLILEALKKSEAQRQRGKAPGLFVEQASLPRRTRQGTPAWVYGLGVLLLAGLAWLGWREWSRQGQATAEPASATLPSAAAPATATAPASAPAPGTASLPAAPPTPEPPSSGVRAVAPPPEPMTVPIATAPVASQATVPAPSRPPPASSSTSSAGASVAAPPTFPAPAIEEPAQPALPRLADLPAAERNGLPPLKITMHVFSEEPAQRFVILDGRRHGEGGTPADGVVIREIQRDGLVLSFNGRDVLVPRP